MPKFILTNYQVHEWRHAVAILQTDFPNEWDEIVQVMTAFRLYKSQVTVGGGSKSPVSKSLDGAFYALGWKEKQFTSQVVVDGQPMDNPTHKIDCYKNKVALEVEWSNKDPFYDRDLNNFRILFDLKAISVGVIITKSERLQETFGKLVTSVAKGKNKGKPSKVLDKFNASTTWLGKLLPRVDGGGGGGCPILVIGIDERVYVMDDANPKVPPQIAASLPQVDEDEN